MPLKLRNPFKKKKKASSRNAGSGPEGVEQVGGSNSAQQEWVRSQPRGKDKLKDRHVLSERALGGGSANEVTQMEYRRGIGESGATKGFFKTDEVGEDLPGEGFRVGITAEDAHLSARAVTSSRLDRALGTNVLSHDTFAKHHGQRGVVSGQVAGNALVENIYKETEDLSHLSDEDFAHRAKNASAMYKFDHETRMKSTLDDQAYNELDWSDPEIQRGLSNLQVMDWLTGQVDRHSGNIFVDPETGNVSGIDNDLSFGSDNTNLERCRHQVGMPSQVDAQTGLRLMNMEEGEFLDVLRGQKGDYGKLTEPEIEAALERFHQLKAQVDAQFMNDELVWEWNEETAQRSLDDPTGNYLGRHKSRYDEAKHVASTGMLKRARLPGQKMAS